MRLLSGRRDQSTNAHIRGSFISIGLLVTACNLLLIADAAPFSLPPIFATRRSGTCSICTPRSSLHDATVTQQPLTFRSSSYSSPLGVDIPEPPRLVGDNIVLEFGFGRYSPAGVGQNAPHPCYTNTTLGANINDGFGYRPAGETDDACADWGNVGIRDSLGRGHLPALMLASVGKYPIIDETAPSSIAFDRHFEDVDFCSPQRMIKTNMYSTHTIQQLANDLYADKSNVSATTRAKCDALYPNMTHLHIPSYEEAGVGQMAKLYSQTMPFAYVNAEKPGQPKWSFRMDTDSTEHGDGSKMCLSRYIVKGKLEGTLNDFGSCKAIIKDSVGTSKWDTVVQSSIENKGTNDELVVQSFPVCLYRLTASKSRSIDAIAELHKDTVCTEVKIQTRTTYSFTSRNLNLGINSGLPNAYTQDVDLIPSTPLAADINVVAATFGTNANYLVEKTCFEQCQRAYSSACDGECYSECAIATYPANTAGFANVVPDSFGHLEVRAIVEIARQSSASAQQPYVANSRTFAAVTPGVGSVNVDTVEIDSPYDGNVCSDGSIQTLSDVTYSSVNVKSRRKRVLEVNANGATPQFELKVVTVNNKQGLAWVQNSASSAPLVADEDVFSVTRTDDKHGTTSQCTPQATKFDPVSYLHMPPAGTYSRGTDYAFQIQLGQCNVQTSVGSCWSPSSQIDCEVGEFKTVNFNLDYRVTGQQYANPVSIANNLNVEVYQGVESIGVDGVLPEAYPTHAKALADATLAIVGANESLQVGTPYELFVSVDGSPLGDHFTMQTKSMYTAIKSRACDPHGASTTVPACAEGSITGACGVNPDQSDRTVPRHALAEVMLMNPGLEGPTSADVRALMESTPWYGKLLTDYGTANAMFCWGDTAAIGSSAVTTADSRLWCVLDKIKTMWDGVGDMLEFLLDVNTKTCATGVGIWTCNTANSQCSQVFGVNAADYCLGGTPGSTQSNAFVNHYRVLPIVDQFMLQANKMREMGALTYSDIGADCLHLTSVDTATEHQTKVSNPIAPECGGMDRLISPSLETMIKMRRHGAHSSTLSVAVDSTTGNVQDAARHQQCLGSAKSTVTSQRVAEQAIIDRNWLTSSVYFGSANAIPCVEQEVFMVAKLVDTRNANVCRRAKVECKNGLMTASRLSEVTSSVVISGVQFTPDATQEYTLYRVDSSISSGRKNPDCHYSNANQYSADTMSCPPLTAVPLVLLEGIDVDSCGTISTNHHIEQKSASDFRGLRWKTGAVEYFTESSLSKVTDITEKNGQLLYIVPTGINPSDHDLVPLTCGDASKDMTCEFATLPPLTGLRRSDTHDNSRRSDKSVSVSVTTKSGTSGELIQRMLDVPLGRRSNTDQDVFTAHTISGGQYVVETCATTIRPDAQCESSHGYVSVEGYLTKKCADNVATHVNGTGICTHSYCCTTIGGITINNYHTVNGPCSDVSKSDTKLMIVYITTLSLGSFGALFTFVNLVIIAFAKWRYPLSRMANKVNSLPVFRMVLMIASSSLLFTAIVLALYGIGSDGWVDKCNVSNKSEWTIWLPSVLLAVVLANLMHHMRSVFDNEDVMVGEQQPETVLEVVPVARSEAPPRRNGRLTLKTQQPHDGEFI